MHSPLVFCHSRRAPFYLPFGTVTRLELALSAALVISVAWAVVLIWRRQGRLPRASPASPSVGDEDFPDFSHCESLDDLARHLIEVAKLAASGRDIDLIAYADRVLATQLGRDLEQARRSLLNRRFALPSLLKPRERMSLMEGQWLADCPRCYLNEKRGTLRIDERAACFRCGGCGAEGGCFEMIVLTVPRLRKFLDIDDVRYRRALMMFRFGLLVKSAQRLVRDSDPGNGNCGKPAPLRPQGPWRPRGAGRSALEVALSPHQEGPCLQPRGLAASSR